MGSSGGGGGGGGDTTNTIRYAPYIENIHSMFLNNTHAIVEQVRANNPYTGFNEVSVDAGFFGTGYVLASFPALFDLYGKFIAGLDIEALWYEILESTSDSPQVNSLVAAESALLDDELESSILPKYMTGMRDLNAVMSSSFVVGKALLYDTKQKVVSKFSADMKWKLISIAQDRWKAHLAWNSESVSSYARLFDLYFNSKDSMGRLGFEGLAKKALWPLDVLDYERANLGALTGAQKQTSNSSSSSGGSKAAGVAAGALGGAAMGASVAGPWGALAGGVIGGLASLL